MPSEPIIFAGVELSAGSRPVTFAALDGDLNVYTLKRWEISEAISCLEEYKDIWLAINLSSFKREQDVYTEFKRKIVQAGFKSHSKKGNPKQWLETNAQDCLRALIGQNPLPRRTLEGRRK